LLSRAVWDERQALDTARNDRAVCLLEANRRSVPLQADRQMVCCGCGSPWPVVRVSIAA
jgi:hypothetical protein